MQTLSQAFESRVPWARRSTKHTTHKQINMSALDAIIISISDYQSINQSMIYRPWMPSSYESVSMQLGVTGWRGGALRRSASGSPTSSASSASSARAPRTAARQVGHGLQLQSLWMIPTAAVSTYTVSTSTCRQGAGPGVPRVRGRRRRRRPGSRKWCRAHR